MDVEAEAIDLDGLTLGLAEMTLAGRDGAPIILTAGEVSLLRAFVRSRGRVLSRAQLLDMASGRDAQPFDRSIDVRIGRLRRKIERDPADPRLIVTVAGAGYRLAVRVRPAARPQDAAASIPVRPPASSELGGRTRVTVMVCALCDEAAMPVQMDPEEREQTLARFYACCDEIVTRMQGTIGPAAGDAIRCYFGHPAANEHSAERAIRAGLALASEIPRLSSGRLSRLHASIGIATSEVVVRDLQAATGRSEITVVGEAPELAARIAAKARAGAVMVSLPTKALAGHLFEYGDPLAAGDGVQAVDVLGEARIASRFDARRGGQMAALHGRRDELDLLHWCWQQAEAGKGRVVRVIGEPGIGKSRLVHELSGRLSHHAQVICPCSPHQQGSPYHPFLHHLTVAAACASTDAPAASFMRLHRLLDDAGCTPAQIAVLANLLSLPIDGSSEPPSLGPAERRAQIESALIGYFTAAAPGAAVLLVIEDTQWIDPSSKTVVATIADRIGHLPMLMIMTCRPGYDPPCADVATTIVLDRLAKDDAGHLVREIGRGRVSDAMCRRIVDRADGVPLFLEELAKSASAADAGTAAMLPANLHDLLMERLDRLPAAKPVAQIASVLGQSFSLGMMTALADQPEQQLHAALDQLVAAGLTIRRGGSAEAGFAFKHALIHAAAYQSMLRSRRTQLHRRAVETMLAAERANVQPEILAHHCEHGRLITKAYQLLCACKPRSRGTRRVRGGRTAVRKCTSACRDGTGRAVARSDGIEHAAQSRRNSRFSRWFCGTGVCRPDRKTDAALGGAWSPACLCRGRVYGTAGSVTFERYAADADSFGSADPGNRGRRRSRGPGDRKHISWRGEDAAWKFDRSNLPPGAGRQTTRCASRPGASLGFREALLFHSGLPILGLHMASVRSCVGGFC